MPPRVEEAPGQKRKRKGAVKLQDFHQWYLAACAWGPGLARLWALARPLLTWASCRCRPHRQQEVPAKGPFLCR